MDLREAYPLFVKKATPVKAAGLWGVLENTGKARTAGAECKHCEEPSGATASMFPSGAEKAKGVSSSVLVQAAVWNPLMDKKTAIPVRTPLWLEYSLRIPALISGRTRSPKWRAQHVSPPLFWPQLLQRGGLCRMGEAIWHGPPDIPGIQMNHILRGSPNRPKSVEFAIPRSNVHAPIGNHW